LGKVWERVLAGGERIGAGSTVAGKDQEEEEEDTARLVEVGLCTYRGASAAAAWVDAADGSDSKDECLR
jgi:hypothetical protein